VEVVQQAMAVIGGAIGIVTAILTLYAKYLDVKKATQDRVAAEALARLATPAATFGDARRAEPMEPPPTYAPPARDAAAIERVRRIVKGPALALMIAGGISLFGNLGLAVYGYVDEFVTPLNDDTRARKAFEAARNAVVPLGPERPGAARLDSPQATVVMTMFTLLSFAVASAIAIWAGYGMLRLRSYWLSVAGSVAVMPGACMCCFAGMPIGVWSLTVLFRPDVAAAFR